MNLFNEHYDHSKLPYTVPENDESEICSRSHLTSDDPVILVSNIEADPSDDHLDNKFAGFRVRRGSKVRPPPIINDFVVDTASEDCGSLNESRRLDFGIDIEESLSKQFKKAFEGFDLRSGDSSRELTRKGSDDIGMGNSADFEECFKNTIQLTYKNFLSDD